VVVVDGDVVVVDGDVLDCCFVPSDTIVDEDVDADAEATVDAVIVVVVVVVVIVDTRVSVVAVTFSLAVPLLSLLAPFMAVDSVGEFVGLLLFRESSSAAQRRATLAKYSVRLW